MTERKPPVAHDFHGHLAQCDYFTVDALEGDFKDICDETSFTSLLVLEGVGTLTKAEARANWWRCHWHYVALLVLAVLAAGYFVWSRVTEVKPDYTVAVVSRTDPDTAFLAEVETQLEALAADVNGDSKVKVNVKGIWLAVDYYEGDVSLQKLMQSSEDKLNSDFYLCESTIFLVDDPAAMEQKYGCFQKLDGTDPPRVTPCRWPILPSRWRTRPLPVRQRKTAPCGTRPAA